MIAVALALIALNVAQYVVSTRREQRLLDAVMTRTPAEYIAAKKADAPAAKPKPAPAPDTDPDQFIHPIGL